MITDLQLKQNPFFLSDEDIAWVKNTLSGLTEDEKIGQLFCLAAFSSDPQFVDYIFHVMKPGGIMYRPMKAAEAVALTHALAEKSTVPMLIAANLEAGANGAVSDGTYLGNEMQVAATGDVQMASHLGEICAEEAGPAGFNWAFAPIIDIDMNFRNPITNTRTFGSDPKLVAAMGEILERDDMSRCEMPYFFFRPDSGMRECIEHWLKAGGTHHEAICLGDVSTRWKMLCEMKDIEYVEV